MSNRIASRPAAWAALEPRDEIAGVVFDWDGVLLDSLGASYNVYNRIFEEIGTKWLTKEEFLWLQSPNWYEFYSKIGLPASLWKHVDDEWLRLYKEENPRLHADAMQCLDLLKAAGFTLALVSNGSKGRVEGELTRFGLGRCFGAVICGEKKEELKPSPLMLQRALEIVALEAGRAVYVGDSPADIQAAKNAGVTSIAIARGPIQVGRLRAENPSLLFGGLTEMTGFLLARRK